MAHRFEQRAPRSSVLATAVLAGAALIGACVGPSVSGAARVAAPRASQHTATLCSVVSRVGSLSVQRTADDEHFGFTFPALVTVTSAARARIVARAVCDLPVMRGRYSCPAEFAVSYELTFAARGEKGIRGESVAFNPTGCETLTGLGANRWIEPQPGFYATLGTALGLHDASRSTFVGAVIDPPLTGVTRGPAGTALDPFSPRAGAPAPGPSR